MSRLLSFPLVAVAVIQFFGVAILQSPSWGQEWQFRKPKGVIKVVDLAHAWGGPNVHYSDSLVGLDKDLNWIEVSSWE